MFHLTVVESNKNPLWQNWKKHLIYLYTTPETQRKLVSCFTTFFWCKGDKLTNTTRRLPGQIILQDFDLMLPVFGLLKSRRVGRKDSSNHQVTVEKRHKKTRLQWFLFCLFNCTVFIDVHLFSIYSDEWWNTTSSGLWGQLNRFDNCL